MTPLLYETYEWSPDRRSVRNVYTNQHLEIVQLDPGGEDIFDYADDDLTFRLYVGKRAPEDGSSPLLYWNDERHREIAQSYGAWRRLSFFLLDGLPVLYRTALPRQSVMVEFLSGWRNGVWEYQSFLRVGANWSFRQDDAHERYVDPPTAYAPTPLDLPPMSWTLRGAGEWPEAVRLEPETIEEDRIGRIASMAAGMRQLANTPLYQREDGKAVLYACSNYPTPGGEYDNGLRFGILTERCGYTVTGNAASTGNHMLTARHAYGDCFAMVTSRIPEQEMRFLGLSSPDRRQTILHPREREELFFTIADVDGDARKNIERLPMVYPNEYDLPRVAGNNRKNHGKQFPRFLCEHSAMPASIGFGYVNITIMSP